MICGLWVMSGSAHEPAAIAGATHLVEHLTLRRCGSRDRRQLAMLVDRLGGDVDAWTSHELMGVSIQTTVDAFEEAMSLLVDAVREPTFDPDDVELELRVARAELELVRDDPQEQVEDAILAAAWGDHPQARPVIGTAESLANLTPEVLRRHHAALVRPGRVLAAVVGDLAVERITARLDGLPLDLPPRVPSLPPLGWVGRHDVVGRGGVDQVHARLAFPAFAAGDPGAIALTVLNRLIGVGASSRLFQRLREEEGLTYDIWSSPVLRLGGGLFEIGWACAPEVFADVRRLVGEELAKVGTDLCDGEVEVAKEGLIRGLVIDAESPAAVCAMDVAELLERGRRFDPEATAAELEGVTTREVRDLARRLLRGDRMAMAVCGPEGLSVRVA